jgi:hypothetical protein
MQAELEEELEDMPPLEDIILGFGGGTVPVGLHDGFDEPEAREEEVDQALLSKVNANRWTLPTRRVLLLLLAVLGHLYSSRRKMTKLRKSRSLLFLLLTKMFMSRLNRLVRADRWDQIPMI